METPKPWLDEWGEWDRIKFKRAMAHTSVKGLLRVMNVIRHRRKELRSLTLPTVHIVYWWRRDSSTGPHDEEEALWLADALGVPLRDLFSEAA